MPFLDQRKTIRRWIREYVIISLLSVLATGLVVGWLLRMLLYG